MHADQRPLLGTSSHLNLKPRRWEYNDQVLRMHFMEGRFNFGGKRRMETWMMRSAAVSGANLLRAETRSLIASRSHAGINIRDR